MAGRLRLFDDGFLLLLGAQVFHWLPNSALVSGSRGDVEELLRRTVEDFAAIESKASGGTIKRQR